jgi:hypothetical protein
VAALGGNQPPRADGAAMVIGIVLAVAGAIAGVVLFVVMLVKTWPKRK